MRALLAAGPVAGVAGVVYVVGVVAAAVSGCGADHPAPPSDADAGPAKIAVTSAAFAEGATIPERFTCHGAGAAPPLSWSGVPASAAALALVVVDRDAHDYYHWVALDLPAAATSIDGPARVEARNSKGATGWTPPCPPSGTHHYRFTVYALDAPTRVAGGASLDDALAALASHGIAQGRLVATYARHH